MSISNLSVADMLAMGVFVAFVIFGLGYNRGYKHGKEYAKWKEEKEQYRGYS